MKARAAACLAALLAVAGAVTAARPANAQAYPTRPIRVIASVGAGSASDLVIRMLTPRLGEALGQPFVLENRPALGGSLAAEQVSKMEGDGYNLLFTTPSSIITGPLLSKNVRYDALRDFTPISAAVEPVTLLVVHSSVPVNSLQELIDHARRNPGKIAYGTPGVGSVFHLVGEAFKHSAGVDILHVPYKNLVNTVQDVASGQIQMLLTAVPNVRGHIAAGKVKALAVLESSRYSGLPEVPAIAEGVPGFEKPSSWFGLLGPAGIQRPIVQRLGGEMAASVNAPETRAKLEAMGNFIVANSPDDFAALIRKGVEQYGRVVRLAGLKPE